MQQYLLNARVEAELLGYKVVEARVGRVGTCYSHNVSKVRQVAAPLCDCFTRCGNGKLDTDVQKDLAEFGDRRWFRTICERMINGVNDGTSLNAREVVDIEDLFQPNGTQSLGT